jgi:hypothetical protein
LTYLGYGYLDTWHGIATLFLLPLFTAGLWRARPTWLHVRDLWQSFEPMSLGRWGLGFLALGMLAAGTTIMAIGMTSVFVPQDLAFMGMTPSDLGKISARLVPVIAHDRAGFGGGLFSTAVTLLLLTRHARLSRSFIQTVAVMGLTGFGAAIGVHPAIGYTDFTHLAPAYLGAVLFAATVLRLSQEYIVELKTMPQSESKARATSARRPANPGVE